MDIVKSKMNERCPVGGIYCPCCNRYKGNDRKKLSRMVRRSLKHELNKEVVDKTKIKE